MKRPHSNDSARESAAYWAVLVDSGDLCAGDRLALAEWLQAAPLHVEEFLMACTTLTAAGEIDPAREINVHDLLRRAQVSVVPLADSAPAAQLPPKGNAPGPAAGPAMKWRSGLAVAAAAAAFVFTAVALRWLGDLPRTGETYVTERGEQRSLTLQDGSVIHINTLSEVSVRYTAALRELTLVSGEAMFEVAPDSSRPFRVIAGSAIVQALGTEFNVYRQERQTEVTVIEGEVALLAAGGVDNSLPGITEARTAESPASKSGESTFGTRTILSIGQGATILHDGTIRKVAAIDPMQHTSWMSRMLVFRNAPLAQVVREFNRYNDVQMRIDDQSIENIPLTAALRADNPHALVDLLASSETIAVDRTEGEIVMRAAHPAEPAR